MQYDELFRAKLTKNHTINVVIHKIMGAKATHFFLYQNGLRIKELLINDIRESMNHFTYDLGKLEDVVLGDEYQVFDNRNLNAYIDTSILMCDPEICAKYYSPLRMGVHYHHYYSTFRLFSPLAHSAFVFVRKNEQITSYTMEKDQSTGVFTGIVQGDLDGCFYYYMLKIDGKYVWANDPNAEAVNIQSQRSIVVNPENVRVDLKQNCLPPLKDINDAIIYELSVRDMTSDKNTSITNKGKFLGLTEEGCTDKNNNPVGIDYIKSLGVSHVQILPMYDFCTGSDYGDDVYNWGYDPLFYNVPEGSYCTQPNNPYNRIIECKQMISKFHESGIRVVMDVVYNHVFNKESNPLDILCPNYYFKFNEDGTLGNGTCCGNDFNSTNPMARQFIVDSCKYWVKEYGVDGFRFDLMGILDVETIDKVYEECKKINPDIIIYGEGWDMYTNTPSEKKAKMGNADKMPSIGFFNDRYRDIVKGKSNDTELAVKGYLTGDGNYIDGFKHVILGSCLPVAFPPLFKTSSQSINYIECHDNATLYDKLKYSNAYETDEQIKARINLLNAFVLLSEGVPFIHAGQEIGATKQNHHNSYNSGDEINGFNYDLRSKNIDNVKYLEDLIKIRKRYNFLRLSDNKEIEQTINFEDLPNQCLKVKYGGKLVPYSKFEIIVNPTLSPLTIDIEPHTICVANEKGLVDKEIKDKTVTISAISVYILLVK